MMGRDERHWVHRRSFNREDRLKTASKKLTPVKTSEKILGKNRYEAYTKDT